MKVILHCSPKEYFEEQLILASKSQSFSPPSEVIQYISNVLSDFIQTELFFQNLNGKKESTNLAVSFLEALQTDPPHLAKENFRRMGDLSMVMSGFFADQFNRKLVDIDYYIGIGETAYRQVANRSMSKDVQSLFNQLSHDFPKNVNLLTEVSYRSFCDSKNILRTYEKWLKTKNSFLEGKLKEVGIFPTPQDDTEFKQ